MYISKTLELIENRRPEIEVRLVRDGCRDEIIARSPVGIAVTRSCDGEVCAAAVVGPSLSELSSMICAALSLVSGISEHAALVGIGMYLAKPAGEAAGGDAL